MSSPFFNEPEMASTSQDLTNIKISARENLWSLLFLQDCRGGRCLCSRLPSFLRTQPQSEYLLLGLTDYMSKEMKLSLLKTTWNSNDLSVGRQAWSKAGQSAAHFKLHPGMCSVYDLICLNHLDIKLKNNQSQQKTMQLEPWQGKYLESVIGLSRQITARGRELEINSSMI